MYIQYSAPCYMLIASMLNVDADNSQTPTTLIVAFVWPCKGLNMDTLYFVKIVIILMFKALYAWLE